MDQEFQPLADRGRKKADATVLVLSENEFWLGKDLATKYRKHYESVIKILGWWHRM